MRHLVRDLIDDHTDQSTRDVIGVLVLPGRLPILVSCGPEGRRPAGHFSLNEVACTEGVLDDGNPHRPQPSRRRTGLTCTNNVATVR